MDDLELIKNLKMKLLWEVMLVTSCEALIESKKPIIAKLKEEIARLES